MNNVCAETERIRKNNIPRIRERTLFAAYKLVSDTSQWNHPESEHIRSFSWHNIYIKKAVSLKLQHTQYMMQNNPNPNRSPVWSYPYCIDALSGHFLPRIRLCFLWPNISLCAGNTFQNRTNHTRFEFLSRKVHPKESHKIRISLMKSTPHADVICRHGRHRPSRSFYLHHIFLWERNRYLIASFSKRDTIRPNLL